MTIKEQARQMIKASRKNRAEVLKWAWDLHNMLKGRENPKPRRERAAAVISMIKSFTGYDMYIRLHPVTLRQRARNCDSFAASPVSSSLPCGEDDAAYERREFACHYAKVYRTMARMLEKEPSYAK
jgi:hypothetical protein